MGNRIQKCETNGDKKGIELPLVGEIDLIGIRQQPKRGKILSTFGKYSSHGWVKKYHFYVQSNSTNLRKKSSLFDLIKKRFVADLQDFG